MSLFQPTDLQKPYGVVLDYARGGSIQVYPMARIPRMPMCKWLGQVSAFDHHDAERKAKKFLA